MLPIADMPVTLSTADILHITDMPVTLTIADMTVTLSSLNNPTKMFQHVVHIKACVHYFFIIFLFFH